MTLVDTNVLLDVATADPRWAAWSEGWLDTAASRGPLVISGIAYAEMSVGDARVKDRDAVLAVIGSEVHAVPRAGLLLAGKALHACRARGGTRTSLLPNFLIGTRAATAGLPLLTRDVGRCRSYFPAVTLIAP